MVQDIRKLDLEYKKSGVNLSMSTLYFIKSSRQCQERYRQGIRDNWKPEEILRSSLTSCLIFVDCLDQGVIFLMVRTGPKAMSSAIISRAELPSDLAREDQTLANDVVVTV